MAYCFALVEGLRIDCHRLPGELLARCASESQARADV